MALNSFFSNYNYQPEQELLEELGIELIKIHGLEVAYLKRSHVSIDMLFMEDPLTKFESYKFIEMQLKSFVGYGAQSDMMTKYGLSMADGLTLTVMRKRFSQEFPGMSRPLEGDLIYIPMTKALFEIKYVEHEDNFYQHGSLQYFDLKCDRFTYSHETFETGNEEIDRIEAKHSTAIKESDKIETEDGSFVRTEDGDAIILTEQYSTTATDSLSDEDGDEVETEDGQIVKKDKAVPFNPTLQNDLFNKKSLEIIDFSEVNPFGKM